MPAIFRDFNGHDAPGGHPDFNPDHASTTALRGLVQADLDEDGKPVLSDDASEENGFMHGAPAFAAWYRDSELSGGAIEGEVVLWSTAPDGWFENRWGKNGESWLGSDEVAWDGTPLFFPIDSGPGLLDEPRAEARIPERYGWADSPWESAVAAALHVTTPIETANAPFPSTTHNYNFTTVIHQTFHYDETEETKISVVGDDDVWIFINGHLAIDMGGWHAPLEGTISMSDKLIFTGAGLDPDVPLEFEIHPPSDFGMVSGENYDVAIFAAKRQSETSTFRLAFGGTHVDGSTPSVCVTE